MLTDESSERSFGQIFSSLGAYQIASSYLPSPVYTLVQYSCRVGVSLIVYVNILNFSCVCACADGLSQILFSLSAVQVTFERLTSTMGARLARVALKVLEHGGSHAGTNAALCISNGLHYPPFSAAFDGQVHRSSQTFAL